MIGKTVLYEPRSSAGGFRASLFPGPEFGNKGSGVRHRQLSPPATLPGHVTSAEYRPSSKQNDKAHPLYCRSIRGHASLISGEAYVEGIISES
jgi:hypothetical protein